MATPDTTTYKNCNTNFHTKNEFLTKLTKEQNTITYYYITDNKEVWLEAKTKETQAKYDKRKSNKITNI